MVTIKELNGRFNMRALNNLKSVVLFSIALSLLGLPACEGDDGSQVSSRAYKGHESDLDANNFVGVYPETLGTRLDDCQTCHTGGEFSYPKGDSTKTVWVNSCDFCHLILHPQADYIEPQPTTYNDTLNPYGLAYLNAGRNSKALKQIAGDDSDGDNFINEDEINDLKYPGDPDSKPGQQVAPMKVFDMAQLKAMTSHEQFLLVNSHKQEYDDYSGYKGVKLSDLLVAAGVDLTDQAITGVTIVAPDGYMRDFTMEQVTTQFPASKYFAGLDNGTLGLECGFVTYPENMPDGLTDGGDIPGEQWLMLGYERDGSAMLPCALDVTSGRIDGEGPYRVVVPQALPDSPDRGSSYSPTECNDGWDYDDLKDHNAGSMVRGVTAVRVNPLPEGTEDFDHKNGGWAFIEAQQVIVYGHGITE